MKVIKPATIGPAQVVSSSVAEDEYPTWSSASTYTEGARTIRLHMIYESLQGSNTNNVPEISPLHWSLIGPTNRWAMFDAEVGTQTTAEGSLSVVIKPGYVDSLALFGLSGSNLSVEVKDGPGGATVYTHEQSLDGSIVEDWYQYFFSEIEQLDEVVLTGLPPYANAHIEVRVTGLTVACGILTAGLIQEIGRSLRGASVGIRDFSRKTTSESGKTTFVKRRYSKWMRQPLVIENTGLNKFTSTLAALRATPCVWIGVDGNGYRPLTIYGFYKDFSVDIAYTNHSNCNLEIEGLT